VKARERRRRRDRDYEEEGQRGGKVTEGEGLLGIEEENRGKKRKDWTR
jgi:hypothetical protein